MRIFKEDKTGLLLAPFGIGSRWYLSCGVLAFFAPENPDSLLPEAVLWQETAPQLSGNLLDEARPKPSGELFCAGCWHSPDGRPASGGKVRYGAGSVSRELCVFGPRYWLPSAVGATPSAPEPVASVPLSAALAFGGEGFDENPGGLGNTIVPTPWGDRLQPLPQVEDPGCGLVDTPAAKPIPAFAGPVPAGAPSRARRMGTTDKAWLAEVWPAFPENVGADFFSLAQPPQRLAQGFFKPGERIFAQGMRPGGALLQGRLPSLTFRVFAVRPARLSSGCGIPEESTEDGSRRFEEGMTRLDTVWLFPEINRAAVIARTVFEVHDDEASDIAAVMVAVEPEGTRHEVSFWREELLRREAEGKVAPMDISSAMDEAQKQVKAALRPLNTLQKDFERGIERSAGNLPSLSSTCKQRSASGLRLANQLEKKVGAVLDRLAPGKGAASAHVRMMPALAAQKAALQKEILFLQQQIAEAGQRFARAQHQFDRGRALLAGRKKQLSGRLDALTDPDVRAVLDSSAVTGSGWNRSSFAGEKCTFSRDILEFISGHPLSEETAESLERTGIVGRHIPELLAGELSADEELLVHPHEGEEGPPVRVRVPAGILLPYFCGTRCTRLEVRPLPSLEDPFSACLAGSDKTPFLLEGSRDGAMLAGGGPGLPVVVVADPLVAWGVYADVADRAAVLMLSSRKMELPAEIAEKVARASEDGMLFLPCPPAVTAGLAADEVRKAVAAEAASWPSLPGVLPVVWEERFSAPDLARAREKGLDVRSWLTGLFPPSVGQSASSGAVTSGKKGSLEFTLPKVDVKALYLKARAIAEEKRKAILEDAQKGLAECNKYLELCGHAPVMLKDILKETSISTEPDPQILQCLDRMLSVARDQKSAKAEKMALDARKLYLENLQEFAQMDRDSRKMLADAKATWAAMGPPPGITAEGFTEEEAEALGLSGTKAPLLPGSGKKPAREEKAAALEKLRAKDTFGLELTDLDLSGENLDGLSFETVTLVRVNLSGASLQNCRFERSTLKDCRLDGANLTDARIDLTSFEGCDFSGTVFPSGPLGLDSFTACTLAPARSSAPVFEETTFTGGTFLGDPTADSAESEGGAFAHGCFTRCTFEEMTMPTDFADCTLEQCTFSGSLPALSFSRCRVERTNFMGCQGNRLKFADCRCLNVRFNDKSVIEQLSFVRCDCTEIAVLTSRLDGALFEDCLLDRAAMEKSSLTRASFVACRADGASLQHCDFEKAIFAGSSFPRTSFRRSRLVGCDFTETNLYGSDFYHAAMGQTRLEGANLTRSTLEKGEAFLKKTERSL